MFRIFWSHTIEGQNINFSNVPFVVTEVRKLHCQFGQHYYKEKKATSDFMKLQGTRKIGCPAHFVLLPTQEAHHSFHKTSGEVGFSQKIHTKLVEKINELVSEGAVTTQEVKRALKRHVHHVLCPHQTIEASNRTYFPTETDIRNHIYSAQKALEMSKFDQDNLMLKIDQWEKGNPTSKFYFCAYKDHENLSEEKAELMHHINFFMSTRSNGSSSF